MTDNVVCLYHGQALEEFGDDTAWVAKIASDESVLDWLIDNGFGKRWSIFLRSQHQLADVVRHLRKFTMIEDEEGTGTSSASTIRGRCDNIFRFSLCESR